jgi:hypothetical protein
VQPAHDHPPAQWRVQPLHRHQDQSPLLHQGRADQDRLVLRAPVPARREELQQDAAHRRRGIQAGKDWWCKDTAAGRARRKETPFAWQVTLDEIKARNYNLDIKNPNAEAAKHGDPDELLADYKKLLAEVAAARDALRSWLRLREMKRQILFISSVQKELAGERKAIRDYTSNASVQVMLFADRLEVWNPGELPPPLTLEKLRKPHASIPHNPLIAEPMFLATYAEKAGSGILDMMQLSRQAGLRAPAFRQDAGQFVQTSGDRRRPSSRKFWPSREQVGVRLNDPVRQGRYPSQPETGARTMMGSMMGSMSRSVGRSGEFWKPATCRLEAHRNSWRHWDTPSAPGISGTG